MRYLVSLVLLLANGAFAADPWAPGQSVPPNTVLAGPSSGSTSAKPVARAVVLADIPNSVWAAFNSVGTLGARPAAAAANDGFLYLATNDNGGTLYRSNGSTWVQAAAGVSASSTLTFNTPLVNTANTITLGTLTTPTTADTSASVVFGTAAADKKVLVLQQKSGQSARPFEIQLSTSNQIFAVDQLGRTSVGTTLNPARGLSVSQSATTTNTAPTSNTVANAYLQVGGSEFNNNSYRSIYFGYWSPGNVYAPAYVAFQERIVAGNTYGDLGFGTRIDTGDSEPIRRMTITYDGAMQMPGLVTGSAPAVADASAGRIYYNSTLQSFMVSNNSGSYSALPTSNSVAYNYVVLTAANTNPAVVGDGSSFGGITVHTGDQILSKDYLSTVNGVYTVNAVAPPTRTAGANAATDWPTGKTVYVRSGRYRNATFTMYENQPGTINVDPLNFSLIIATNPIKFNTFAGNKAGDLVTAGSVTAFGDSALMNLTGGGSQHTAAFGTNAGLNDDGGGSQNTYAGDSAGSTVTSGGGGLFSGYNAGSGITTATSCTFLGAGTTGTNGNYGVAVGAASSLGSGNYHSAYGVSQNLTSTGQCVTALGSGSTIGGSATNVFLFGYSGSTSGSDRVIFGSPGFPVKDVWFGSGENRHNARGTALHSTDTATGSPDTTGSDFVLAAGQSTGTGAGTSGATPSNLQNGAVRLQVSKIATTGSTLNATVDRLIAAQAIPLVNNTDTMLFDVAMPTLTVAGGTVDFTLEVGDGTDVQSCTGTAYWNATNKGGVYTITTPGVTSDTITTSGTLVTTFTVTAGTNKITFNAKGNTSLTSTYIRITYTINNLSGQAITLPTY